MGCPLDEASARCGEVARVRLSRAFARIDALKDEAQGWAIVLGPLHPQGLDSVFAEAAQRLAVPPWDDD